MYDLAWAEFTWLPDGLISNWIRGVKANHEQHGWKSMPSILWDKDTMIFIGCSKGLMEMLEAATKSWRGSKRHEAETYLASIVLSIECLGCNFAGWGDRYPDAKEKADQILDTYFGANRTRLLDVYMPLRSQLDQTKIREVLGPKD
jgi:hypothetical protein